MRIDEANTVVPLDFAGDATSDELRRRPFFLPQPVSLSRGTRASAVVLRRESAWAASRLGHASACFVGRRVLRAGPAVVH